MVTTKALTISPIVTNEDGSYSWTVNGKAYWTTPYGDGLFTSTYSEKANTPMQRFYLEDTSDSGILQLVNITDPNSIVVESEGFKESTIETKNLIPTQCPYEQALAGDNQ